MKLNKKHIVKPATATEILKGLHVTQEDILIAHKILLEIELEELEKKLAKIRKRKNVKRSCRRS